uniref:ATP synthase F0 subunit 8 n=1 Tax=Scolytus sp. APV-2011 TaxID=1069884 RepID=J9PHT5_9CUCU|nr:ATP synthase F0 subunit 8 [Scolytus sp. APV-2011]
MPQMSPIMWLSLFLMFSTTFMMTIIINYFMFSYKYYVSKTTSKTNMPSWKW